MIWREYGIKCYSIGDTKMRISIAKSLNVALLFCLLTMCLLVNVEESHAKDKKSQQFSKDYKSFPAGSPEAVVASFIEYADLAKDANREDGDRFPLFWSLTELSSVPENSQRLIIKSYKIDGKNILPSGDVIVNLKMDVRAIALSSCDPKDSGYNYQRNNCNWRERILVVPDPATGGKYRVDAANTETFIRHVFGNSETSTRILSKTKGIYAIPKAAREWSFEIRLVKKKGKWLISQDSVPIEVRYIGAEINKYRKLAILGNEAEEICEGKRIPDKNSFYFDNELREKRCKANIDIRKGNAQSLLTLESVLED